MPKLLPLWLELVKVSDAQNIFFMKAARVIHNQEMNISMWDERVKPILACKMDISKTCNNFELKRRTKQ